MVRRTLYRCALYREIDPGAYDNILRGLRTNRDDLEVAAMSLVSLLADHAADTGASGELMLRAQLLLPVDLMPAELPVQTEIHAARHAKNLELPPDKIPESLTLIAMSASATTVLVEEIAGSAAGAIRGAYPLACDVLAEFGVAGPTVLRADGTICLDDMYLTYRNQVLPWAEVNKYSGWTRRPLRRNR